MERETGFEPATSTLARSHSTTELFPLAPKGYRTTRSGWPSSRVERVFEHFDRRTLVVEMNRHDVKPACAIAKTMTTSDMKDFMASQGADVALLGPQEFGRYIEQEMVKWGKVARAAKLSASD